MYRMTSPPDARTARVAALFDRAAETYESVGIPWFVPIARRLVDLVDPQPGERAVDLGCGRGAALFPVAERVGPDGRVTGVDLSERMVELTKERCRELGLTTVDLHVMDAAAPDLPAAQADLVTASLVLFFLPEPERALAAWTGLLRPGGRLGISTFAERDEVWVRLDALFRPYLPPQMLDPRTTGQVGPFASDQGVEELFAAAGLVDLATAHADVELAFPDLQAWATWSWSHGQRLMWENVPADQHDALLQAADGVLAEARDGDGVARVSQRVRYTLGRRPE